MERWRGIAYNDLIRIVRSGLSVFLVPMKEGARKQGIKLSNGSIAEFLANKNVENYVKKKLAKKISTS